ncbi:MAG: hypothetical protein K6F50_06200 [Kiritimatiellae bacterium]|nr:hypothetical protein [Kiritimatiellia bacterium]
MNDNDPDTLTPNTERMAAAGHPRSISVKAATAGILAGCAAIAYILNAYCLTLFNLGMDVGTQLSACKVMTVLIFTALAAMLLSAETIRRQCGERLGAGSLGASLRALRLAAVILLPAVLVLFTLQTPIWSYPSPASWNRPQFAYGWPLMWKREGSGELHFIVPMINFIFWTAYLALVLGYRKLKHYLVMLSCLAALLVLYALLFEVGTTDRNRQRDGASYRLHFTESSLATIR